MIAFVRELSPLVERCELSYIGRVGIDAQRARRQHQGYVAELAERGCELRWLPPLQQHADGVFVEDTAVVLPELTVITRPGAVSRRAEVDSVELMLAPHTQLVRVRDPGTLEGGDVLGIGRRLYVGVSGRTNEAGIAQLAAALAPFAYTVHGVAMRGCLHLKSAATFIPPDTLLVNPEWVDPALFDVPRVVHVAEPFGANTLTLDGVTLVSSDYPATQERLRAAGIATRALEVSELHKAEAALTCMSLIFETLPASASAAQARTQRAQE
jgi:dimethylargininase